MSARTLDYRGRLVPTGHDWQDVRDHLQALAVQFPVGGRVVHASGRRGTVTADQPVHVPGLFAAWSSAVCLADPFHSVPMVFVSWDNEAGIVWLAWAPANRLRATGTPAVNRPSNRATVNGRQKSGRR